MLLFLMGVDYTTLIIFLFFLIFFGVATFRFSRNLFHKTMGSLSGGTVKLLSVVIAVFLAPIFSLLLFFILFFILSSFS